MPPRRAPNGAVNSQTELGHAKLATSGLTEEDGDALGLEYLSGSQTAALCSSFKALAAIKIPYFTPTEPAQAMTSWPQAAPFYRLRYLETPNDFNRVTAKKQQRYVQPAASGVCAYFPRLMRGWQQVLQRPDVPLFITEGEFKAAKACKVGFPTIGLGGVYNWRSNQHGHFFLPELEAIAWRQRHVYIVFDSDARSNPQVCHALNALGEQLQNRGAFPYYLPLPETEGNTKTGLDDFLVAERDPKTALQKLVDANATLITLARPLWKMNEKVIYIFNPGLVVDLGTKMKMDPTRFVNSAYATEEAVQRTVNPKDGSIKLEPVSAAAVWIKWPLRHEASQMTYKPGHDTYVRDEDGRIDYNIWPGWGCKPTPGDATPFIDLIKHLFKTTDDEGAQAAEWFFDWLAYPVQNPGVKLFTSVLIHGRRQGTGKSLVGYTMARIYGKNFTEINQASLHADFNEWAECKQFVMGDDVTGSNKRGDADILKKMVTQRELRVNAKYIPSYIVPDCINFYFTSNHPDAFFLEDDDRRFFVHEVLQPPLPESFYVEYMMWLDSGGAAHVFDWLMKRDLSEFNPAAHAFSTAAKRRMISDVKSDLGAWVEQLRQYPDQVLKLDGGMTLPGDLFTAKQLLQLFDPFLRTGTTANGLAREMKRAGFAQVCEGKGVRGPEGNLDRYFAVRNPANWLDRNQDFAAEYLRKLHAGEDVTTPPATIIVLNRQRERRAKAKKY